MGNFKNSSVQLLEMKREAKRRTKQMNYARDIKFYYNNYDMIESLTIKSTKVPNIINKQNINNVNNIQNIERVHNKMIKEVQPDNYTIEIEFKSLINLLQEAK